MNKWADYLIVRVRYDNDHSRIVKVKCLPDLGDDTGDPIFRSRDKVIQTIEDGVTYITVYEKDQKWSKGANVGVITVEGTEFIRTDGNQTKADNLGKLPEF